MSASRVRIWIAGPRAWSNPEPIQKIVRRLEANYGIARLLVMTGGAPGVDLLAEQACNERGIHVFACRACWPVGRHAGPMRNTVIAQEFAPRVLIALHYFPLDETNHRGTQSAIKNAKRYNIPVKIVRVSPNVALPDSVSDESPMGPRARQMAGAAPRNKKRRRDR